MADLPSDDLRKNKRITFIKEVEVAGSGTQRCSDLSVGGLYLETVASFPGGTLLDLQFKLNDSDDKPIKVQGRVLYQHPGVGVGLGFVNLLPKDREALVKFLDQH